MNNPLTTPAIAFQPLPSALGWLLLAASNRGICLVHFWGSPEPSRESCRALIEQANGGLSAVFSPDHALLQRAEAAIQDYLHHCQPLPELPLDLSAGTAFQRQVWEALRRIPFGETRSYVEVARAVDRPRASRAVGQACGRNPLPLFIPCHRVISATGTLGGFSGGIQIKKALLALEQGRGVADTLS